MKLFGLVFMLICLSYHCVNVPASDEIPGRMQIKPIAIINATLHPVSGPALERGSILFEDGKIKAIGATIDIPAEAEKIEAAGRHVYPGLIDAATILGLVEINSIRATVDTTEIGLMNPNVRSWVAFNPDSEIIPVTRSNGILLALTMPQGGLISGRSALMQLDGWTWEDMAIRTDVGLHVQWPSSSTRTTSNAEAGDESAKSDASVRELRDFFVKVREYRRAKESGLFEGEDLRMESMLSILDGEVPLFIHADRMASIEAAVAFSVEQKVRMVLVGGYDAPHCAALLRKQSIPVIVAGTYRLPSRDDDGYDHAYTVPARLHQAKIAYCLASRGRFGATGVRNLPYHAATAVAYGLPRDEALKAMTIHAAKILGVDDRVGSLEVGKEATLFISNGDPMEPTTTVEAAFVQGRTVDLGNRHKRLYDKYQQKYRPDGL